MNQIKPKKEMKENLTILLKDIMLVKRGSTKNPSYYIPIEKVWIKSEAINPNKSLIVRIEQK